MHIVLSWDINVANPKRAEIDENLKKCLEGYSWVRPLTTFYIIKTKDEADRVALRDKLVAVARADATAVRIVISPSMVGGRYDGFLAKDQWEKINKRSDP